MAKKSASYELILPQRDSGVTAYRWLYESLRAEILSGRLRSGTRLPATRDLARQYGLARGTIVTAFDQLRAEGYIEGTVGSGTFVSETLPDGLLNVELHGSARVEAKQKRLPRLSDYALHAKLFRGYEDRPIRAFRANLPALDLFPTDLWTTLTTRCLRRISTRNLMGCDPLGYEPLRHAVAEYLGHSRGVRCTAEQVAIVSGVQEAIDLSARILLGPGDGVCVEDPGYPGAAWAFRAFGAHVHNIAVGDDGFDIARLPARGIRLIYVTPGHQFPMGSTMNLSKRLQLLAWARRSRAVIFEDDYDSEYRYSGRPIPALQGLDEHGLVIYAGSFSKVLFPSLRLGYVVVPLDLVRRFEAALSLTVRHAPLLDQLVLAQFIGEGHFGRHVRRMREIYAERLAVLLEESRNKLAGLLEMSEVEAGLQTIAWLCRGVDGESAAEAAARRGVDVTPLARYSPRGAFKNGLRLDSRRSMNVRSVAECVNWPLPIEGLRRTSGARVW